nr:hypothetical protein [Tanacetum cinerariifolium]
MLEKGSYDTWYNRLLIHVERKENGQSCLISILNCSYQFKEIDDPENQELRRSPGKKLQTMADLNVDERKKVECGIKAAN